MKTLKEIAQVVVERRQRPNPTVMQGEMIEALGSEGFATAIERRWLVPSYDSGFLQVTNNESVVQEFTRIAEMPEAKPETNECQQRNVVLEHAFRGRNASTMRLDEIAAPATGKPAPTFRVSPPAASSPAPMAPRQPGGPRNVGDDVAVVENGKTYQGKVQRSENGKYRISFGGPERPSQDREYSDEELQAIQAAR